MEHWSMEYEILCGHKLQYSFKFVHKFVHKSTITNLGNGVNLWRLELIFDNFNAEWMYRHAQ
jgi:hypothetical protein